MQASASISGRPGVTSRRCGHWLGQEGAHQYSRPVDPRLAWERNGSGERRVRSDVVIGRQVMRLTWASLLDRWHVAAVSFVRIEGVRGSNPLNSTHTAMHLRKRPLKIIRTKSGTVHSWGRVPVAAPRWWAASRSADSTMFRRRSFFGHQCT
jgi:hypothetical protein